MLKIKRMLDEAVSSMRTPEVVSNFVKRKDPKLKKQAGLPLQAGDVVQIEGLEMDQEKQFNRLRGIVLEEHSVAKRDAGENTYVVVVEGTAKAANCRGGKSYKELTIECRNLRKFRSLPLPKGIERGRVIGDGWSPKARAWKLTENLVRETDKYKPSEILFMGEAASTFMASPGYPGAFEYLSCSQMEQLGGLLALANMASTEKYAVEVVFALLEADAMVIDVSIMLFTCTPYIGSEAPINRNDFDKADPLNDLTPPQDSFEYVHTIRSGPLKLLTTICYQQCYQAVLAVMRRSPLFHLFVRRLLSIISREIGGFQDGLELARYCKGLLDVLCDLDLEHEVNDRYFMNPLPAHVGRDVLSKTAGLKTFDDLQPVLQNVFSQL